MPPTLKYLDVEYNHIRSISHLTLEKLNLTYLNMKSYYKDLVKNNIWSMKHLEELFQTIDSNTITLQSCENLKVLYVFFFGISQFNNFESFVRKCQSLRTLELTFYGSLRNSNEIIILNNIVLKELRMFSIFCDSMYKLNTSFLDNHKQLTDVSLSGNIDLSSLEKLDNVLKLEISGEITDLDKDTFKSQQRVLYIGLTSTKLEELPETIFSYNSHLIKLNLQSNKLTNLSKNIFNNLKNLIILNLSKNQLTNLPDDIFHPLFNIRRINLSQNKLKTFNFKAFLEGVFNLESDLLNVYEKYLKELGTSLDLPRIDELVTGIMDLQDNGNYLLDTFNPIQLNAALKSTTFRKFWNFRIYESNRTKCFCQKYEVYSFLSLKKSFENLRYIEISVNCDSPTKKQLHEYIDEDFKSMIYPWTCPGKCLESVNRLDCSNSGLTSIPEINNRNIKELDLRNNKLIYLDQTFIDKIKKHDIPTYLSGNDWKCDCDNLTFVDLVRNTSQIRDEVNCWLDEENKISTKFSDDKIQEMCSTSSHFYIILILASFMILFGTSSVSLYFRKEIRIWLFAHRMFLCCTSEEEVDKSRIYDAFICFSHEDEHYVEQIVQVLESGPNPYRLCLHFRDWLVGEYISTQIVNSVDKSKRTIFIITNNFLNSMWSRLEFRTACASSLKEKRPRLIVVLCQEIEELDQLDSEIKAYFNSNTYLSWNDKLFWSRLKYALPHKKQDNISNDIELVEIYH